MSPSNRRSAGTFRAFGSYVPKVTAKCFERHGFHLVEIILNWPAIVGRSLARIEWIMIAVNFIFELKPVTVAAG